MGQHAIRRVHRPNGQAPTERSRVHDGIPWGTRDLFTRAAVAAHRQVVLAGSVQLDVLAELAEREKSVCVWRRLAPWRCRPAAPRSNATLRLMLRQNAQA